MLDSQLATLQDPTGEVGVSIVDIGQEPEDEAKQAVEGVLAMCRK
jgi:gluconate kinase